MSELKPAGDDAPNPAVEVERAPAHASSYAAVVRLRGEHDLDSSVAIGEALATIDGDVLVDLSACGFMDSSVISTLLRAARERARAGGRLELIVPAENRIVVRMIEIASLRELLTVHDGWPGDESPRTVQVDHP